MAKNRKTQLGFGAMRLPQTDKNNPTTINMDEFTQMIDYYMNQGFNYFDTSYAYHNEKSENAIKEALVKRYPRESYQIADKIPTWLLQKEEDNQRLVNIMLKRLGIEYFDVLLIHNINKSFIKIAEKAKTFQYLTKAKEKGIAKKIGFSYHDKADLLEEILEKYHENIDIVQLQLNYLDWEDQRVQSKKCHEICVKYGIDITVMEPVKGGTLVNIPEKIKKQFNSNNKNLAGEALKSAASQDNVITVLSGMSNLQQMKENCEALKNFTTLNEKDTLFLNHMANEIRKSVAIPCSYCNYCVKECPQNIPIPEYFNLYNTEKMYHLNANLALYGTTASSHAPASNCIECGNCNKYCTQQLNIPELLKKVVEMFE
ncbi:aldo/keto reductase [Methanosphaera sp. ISO3-F5]|uniref:aldo/keto reductase n=1 Tax=Methanosphaera sp. ISO3-F5 TaxID=1452353 RepID=UPI002B262D2D|nr:aldo/keto reductase [Methanosphaera sp. ISO3-F5]WQH64627.1 aldo/keto reductase [Methanosphaera sp. ISO3-F5]